MIDIIFHRLTLVKAPATRDRAPEERPLHVGESDPLTAQPIEQSILGLKEFDDDPLVAMNPTSRDHQQE
jgi:hypothetical protein